MQCKKGKTADRTRIVEQGQSAMEGKRVTNIKSYKTINAKTETSLNTEDQSISMSHGSQHTTLGTVQPAKTH